MANYRDNYEEMAMYEGENVKKADYSVQQLVTCPSHYLYFFKNLKKTS